jgi:acyl carrier protein
MDTAGATSLVIEVVNAQITEKGETAPGLEEGTALLGGTLPIDSLDLAVIVIKLREATGKDPFESGFINFRTVGELARLYAES